MTNKKISELTPTGSPGVNDIIPIVQGGVNKQAELGDLPISTAMQTALDGKQNSLGYTPLDSVVAGTNISIDNTDPLNPVISATLMGTGDVTASGTLTNDTIILGNGTKSVKSSSKTIVTTLGSDDTTLPTSKAVKDVTDTKVTGNLAITGATKTKITYDAKGLVTAGADATTDDIVDSTDKRYVTDAQLTVISNTSGTNTGDETTSTIKTKLGITTLSGSNTGDQDLSGLVPKTTTITINGITQDLSTNRSWTISGGGGGGSLNYVDVTSNQSASPSNFYGVTCTTSDITLTLTNGTTIGDTLSIKKLDNSGYSIIVNGNIELDGTITMGIQYESIDLYWNGTYYLIK